ncbi:MAG: triose-phosphate isomerase [Planctomycetota bacterium]|nr:MAG: triose-phosphate isomerase [Planctomycetota bacterium]
MRKYFIAGNWKMNLLRQSAVDLARGVAAAVEGDQVEVAVCPPFVYLRDVAEALEGSPVGLGGQNMHYESSGAFTGEISPEMLMDVGCRYVILGHSERREHFHETDALVNRKIKAALQAGLTPIVCVGERLEQREAGKTADVIDQQVRGSLADLSPEEAGKLVVAYEPVWAIGTGRTATPQQAEEVHAQIRELLGSLFTPSVAETIRIQYGGSVKPDNAGDLLAQPNIDGALVGGASLKADSFAAIVRAAGD